MKAYDLKPTYENLFKTFTEDTIGRNADVFRFASILDSIDDSCSIALDGKWGSGKTFFIKQTKMVLDAHNEFIYTEDKINREKIVKVRTAHYRGEPLVLQPQVCVYYDAWENDNDDDPILSLLYTIVQSVDTDFSFKDRSCVKVAASIMEVFTGRDWQKMIDSFKGESPLKNLIQAKNMGQLVADFLKTLLPEKGNRLVIFIDELDRCKPSYAVRLLERIKHYFENDQITFVFSVNINELQHTIRKYYGGEFDGTKYLDRFFDLRVTLPPPDLNRFYQSLGFSDTRYIYDMVCGAIIKVYHFELREIAKFLRLAKIAAYEPTHNGRYDFGFSEGRGLKFGLLYIVPIMIALKVMDTKRYFDFIEGRDYKPLEEIAAVLSIDCFDKLLDIDETYDDKNASKAKVTLGDKLKAVYNALFVVDYGTEVDMTQIGRIQFNAETKDILLRTTGLLSRFTNMNEN